MKKDYTHICRGTCSRQITIYYDDETKKIIDLEVVGGCNGNLKGIGELVKGMTLDEVHNKLKGVRCGMKSTSCPDQIALAIEEIELEK